MQRVIFVMFRTDGPPDKSSQAITAVERINMDGDMAPGVISNNFFACFFSKKLITDIVL